MIINTSFDYSPLAQYESIYTLLSNGMMLNDRELMIQAYRRFQNINSPTIIQDKTDKTQSIIRTELNNIPYQTYTDISLFNDDIVRANVKGACWALYNAICSERNRQDRYKYAYTELFETSTAFSPTRVLYQENDKQLTVTNLLDVSKYAIKVAQLIDPTNENYDKANVAVMVFQGIDNTLNNHSSNNNIGRMLHIANDFLTTVVKSKAQTADEKRGVVGISLLVDLAIDFFCKTK